MKRVVQIIVTPGSGEGRAMTLARQLEEVLKKQGDDTAVRTYKSLAALAKWAKTCEPEFTHLVCVGGDGTQSAAAAAAVRLKVPFVPVPSGFGNLFARTFGHPAEVEAVAELLGAGDVRHVDVGTLDDDIFLCHRSYGVLQQIQETVEKKRAQPRSRLARYLAYCGMAKPLIADARPPSLRVEVDGQVVADGAGVVTVANVETYQGFLSLTPAASPLDGLFDVFIIPRTSRLGLGLRLLQLQFKTRRRWRGLLRHRGRRVAVTVNDRNREELHTMPRALPLLVPRGAVETVTQRTQEADAEIQRVA